MLPAREGGGGGGGGEGGGFFPALRKYIGLHYLGSGKYIGKNLLHFLESNSTFYTHTWMYVVTEYYVVLHNVHKSAVIFTFLRKWIMLSLTW
jgi:hypothetical protein